VPRPNINTVPPPPSLLAPANNILNLRAIVDNDFRGVTVSFNVMALTNVASMVLLRSFTNSVLAAKQLENVPLLIGPQNYDDRDPSIVGKQVWYWVQMRNPQGYYTLVGDIRVTVTKGAAPHVVNWVEVSGNTSTDDSVQVHVVCEVVPGTDVSGGIAVFVSNYQGNAAAVMIFQDTSQTLTFELKLTGELVTFQVASVNAAGALSGLSAGVILRLNGIQSRACRLTGLAALEGSGFTQISFLASPEPSVTLYRLYRGAFGGMFSGAALVATLVPTDEPQYSIRDNVVNGHSSTYQWYVTAVNTSGESDPSDAVYPPVWFV
jgi:hypothetical protein